MKGYPNALAVVERIRRGPYPIDLEFYSLDSLATTQLVEGGTKTATQAPVADNNTYVKRVVGEAPLIVQFVYDKTMFWKLTAKLIYLPWMA